MPSHNDTDHSRAYSLNIISGRLGTAKTKLVDDTYQIQQDSSVNLFLDPNGVDRVVRLPPMVEGGGMFFIIANPSAGNSLFVRTANGDDVETILPRQMMMFTSDEAEWITSAGVARAAGPTHRAGQVPDPGPVAAAVRFLREDLQWGSVFVSGVVDAFKFITDGVTTAIGTGPDTFKLRSSDSSVSIAVQNNDATHGDNANFQVDPTHVNHNLLQNYVSNEHVNHAGVQIIAGMGLSGGGDITASRTLNVDFSEFPVVTPSLADFAVFHDTSAGGPGAALWSAINSLLVHNNLSGYVANEHINHSLVSITAGNGLSGGGDLTSTRTLDVDFSEFTITSSLASGDQLVLRKAADGIHYKINFSVFNSLLDHNALLNYSANQHIDHTAVTMTAGAGLTGGGTIAATRTFEVGAGVGITVNADDIALNFNGLAAQTPVTGDIFAFWDISASTHSKCTIDVLATALVALGAAGAPPDGDYVVKSANAGLSAERVLTDAAGGIGWDWATAGVVKGFLADSVTGVAALVAGGGTVSYTPTPTGVANITTGNVSTIANFFIRVSNAVIVFGRIGATATSGTTGTPVTTTFRITLPIASNLASAPQLAGIMVQDNGGMVGSISADSTNDAAVFSWQCNTTSARNYYFIFCYPVM